jgi:hypothetical protein
MAQGGKGIRKSHRKNAQRKKAGQLLFNAKHKTQNPITRVSIAGGL